MEPPQAMEPNQQRALTALVDAGWPVDTPLVPPPRNHPNEPEPSTDDPTGGGYFCGALRSRVQLAQDHDEGIEYPWPWCRMRAGRGTDHVGTGHCRNHGGSTRNHRAAARLQLAELVQPAMATLARALTDPEVPWSVKQRSADSLLDRAGYPRRVDVDVDAQREGLAERLWALREGEAEEGTADG